MNDLKMVEAKLPPGFRFHPRDEELVCDYLMKKITHSEEPPILMEVDLNKSEPWDIPDYASVGGKEWYFYSQRDRKYATGQRTNRATVSGYWKATGKDRPVNRRNSLVGMRKTLVFYQGRAPKGKKTDWVMHEFRLQAPLTPPKLLSSKEDWVLCRVLYKNKEGDHPHTPPSSKQRMSGNCYDTLPPLMDDPPQPLYNNEYQTLHQYQSLFEQVPCFSMFNLNQMNIIPSKFSSTNNVFGDELINGTAGCDDKVVIDAVLSHLTKMDTVNLNVVSGDSNLTRNVVQMMLKDSPCSFGETIWNNY